jgi:oligopeptide/dipeptide ABC transporter ATP-binding protein
MSLLEIRHVTHRYESGSGRPVLNDVELEVDEGEIVAIVGESGCGKTTLGRLAAGLAEPTRGTIAFDGEDVATLRGRSRKSWRRQVQLVHQDPYGSLNPGLTIGSTLAPGLLEHRLATRRTVQQSMVDLLQQVGLDATPAFLQRYPHQLSGGQRQRVSIARAISLRPRLVIADEVTSMLDVSMRVAIMDLLLSFQRERGLGFLFISHDFGVVRYFAQGGRIVVMFFGVVVEEGPVEQLITAPKHPYTHMLLESVPVPDPEVARSRPVETKQLIGEASATGCVFAGRCPMVQDRCRQEAPPLVELGGRHRSACFYADQVPPLRHLTAQPLTTKGNPSDPNSDGGQTAAPHRTGPARLVDPLPSGRARSA